MGCAASAVVVQLSNTPFSIGGLRPSLRFGTSLPLASPAPPIMLSRHVLCLARSGWSTPARRGMAALKNWKKPSMDEYGVPSGSWSQVHDKREARHNMIFVGGFVFLGVTVAIAKASGVFNFYTTPWHLLNDETTQGYKNEG